MEPLLRIAGLRTVFPSSAGEIAAVDGHYSIELPPATNRNPFPGQTVNPVFPIGGPPVILIEKDSRALPNLPFRTYLPSAVGDPGL